MLFVQNWIAAHGGPVASVLAAVIIFNIVMSAVQSIFNQLKIQEPEWMQKAGAIGSKIASWLSANVPSVVAPPKDDVPPQK